MIHSRTALISQAALAIGLLTSAPALAQGTDPQSPAVEGQVAHGGAADLTSGEHPGGLEDIIVTARRVEENLQDIPVAVTAFSGASLQQQNAVRVSDVARLTPSLVIRESNSNATSPAITLRGQVQTDVLATLDPSVGSYVDGLYWARAYGLNGDLLDIQSVQVLKGPQGTLFGRNTTGGAILIQTNNPDLDDFSGTLSGTYGRFDEITATAILNVPVVTDRIAIRAAVQRSRRDGFARETGTGDRFSNRDNWIGRAKLLAQITDNLSFLASAEIYDADLRSQARKLAYVVPVPVPRLPFNVIPGGLAGANAFIDATIADPDSISLNEPAFTTARTHSYAGTLTLDTFFGAIKFIGGYRDVTSTSLLDLDGSPFSISSTGGEQNLSQYSGEVQITGSAFSDSVDFAAGAFYFHEQGVDQSFALTTPALNPGTALTYGYIDNDSTGLYGQATWHFAERFAFTGGLRYSVDDKGIVTRNRSLNRNTGLVTCSIPTAQPTPDCSFQRKNAFAGLSYTAGFDFKPTDDTLLYIKTSKGFRSGGQNLRASSLINATAFQPEIVHAHEAGLKTELFDRRVRLNFAGYYSRTSDAQRSTIISNPPPNPPGVTTILGNAAKVRIYGFEAEVAAMLFEGFQLSGTSSLTKPKYVSYVDQSGDRSSERFDSIPEWTWSVSGSYTRDLDFGRLFLRADYSWIDDQALNSCSPTSAGSRCDLGVVAATTAPSAGILSARASLSFADERFEVAVFGRNLTDDRAVVNALSLPQPIGTVAQLFREPRTYGVSATVRFGPR